jgi:selenocysteine lyase/cysteine desulfurase
MDCKKSHFLLDESVTYLNCAYMSPLLASVEKAGITGIQKKRNPFNITPAEFFGETERLRKAYGRLINADDPKRIVVIPSASYGLGNVAHNLSLSEGDEIVVAGEQFPSNVYPWQTVAKEQQAEIITVSAPDDSQNRGEIWNERMLDAITPNTKMVAIGQVHWADGTLFNLKEIRKRTREVGALLVIDGTQSVGALPFDVQEIEPDALICAGYKWLMGPYSIGLAYYGPAFDDGTPMEENWINRYKSEDFANLVNYSDRYQPGALRYEVGQHSNFILVPMLLKAIQQLNEWGPENIQKYCKDLTLEPIKTLKESGFIIEDEDFRSSHLFGIRLGDHHNMEQIKAAMETQNILVSFRGDSIRVSPNVYNTQKDITNLTNALLHDI